MGKTTLRELDKAARQHLPDCKWDASVHSDGKIALLHVDTFRDVSPDAIEAIGKAVRSEHTSLRALTGYQLQITYVL